MKHIKLVMIVCVLSIFATLAVLNIYNQYKNADLLLDNNIETLTEQESNIWRVAQKSVHYINTTNMMVVFLLVKVKQQCLEILKLSKF